MRKCMDDPDLDHFDFDAEPRNARVPSQVRKAFNRTPWKTGYVVANHSGLVLALTSELCIAHSAMLICMDGHIYTSTPLGEITLVVD